MWCRTKLEPYFKTGDVVWPPSRLNNDFYLLRSQVATARERRAYYLVSRRMYPGDTSFF